MRWEKKLTKEQSDQIQNMTEELIVEAEAEGVDCGMEVDAGWNALEHANGDNLDVRFKVSFFGLTKEDVRSLIDAKAGQ